MAMLPFLFLTCLFSFITLYSSASEISYKHHCGSVVPESNPQKHKLEIFPLGGSQFAYYTGGDRILGVNPSWQQNPFFFRTKPLRATDVAGLFKLEGFVSIRSNFPNYDSRSLNVVIRLHGFWSESTGKLCMVGSSMVNSKGGIRKTLQLVSIFKLNNVFNSSNISTLVSGSLESLSTKNHESYFEPFYVLMLPQLNYKYTLDSDEAKDEFVPIGNDHEEKGLSEKQFSLCSFDVFWGIPKFQLEYSSDCNSLQNCTPFSGISGYLPPVMYLKIMECSLTQKHHFRVLIKFDNHSYDNSINQDFNPKTMLVGEGWWDEKNNYFCVVACHFLGLESSSFASVHVGDFSVRLRFTFPLVRSIRDTSFVVGKIWSNKTVTESGYFKEITFRKEDDEWVRVQGLKYEYTQLDRVNNLCPRKMSVKKGEKYLTRIMSHTDIKIRDSNGGIVGWGNSATLFLGDQPFYLGYTISPASPPSSLIAEHAKICNNSGLFNISYKISLSCDSILRDSNSLFNLSEAVMISAEGIHDEGTGSMCMVGCRNLPPSNNGIPMAHSLDCEILVKFQFPKLPIRHKSYIVGTIESTRKKSDPLYFKSLNLTSLMYFVEESEETVQTRNMEIVMVLVSTTLACVFGGFQLYHVKRNPKVLPFISLIMLSILTFNQMMPVILNFEALFTINPNPKATWLERIELTLRLTTMAAFFQQFLLLHLTWSARKSTNGTQKSLWIAEKEVVYVTLPLYAAGFLVTMMVKWKKMNELWIPISLGYRQASSWEVLKTYGGLVLDGFLLPQIIMNMFSNMKENALSFPFYFGTSCLRLLPHAYALYRTSDSADQYDGSYLYVDPSAGYYSTAWDIAIPFGSLLFAVIIYFQQHFGGSCILLLADLSSLKYMKKFL